MIRPSCPTTAVESVCVTCPPSARAVTPKNCATSSTCAGVPVASVQLIEAVGALQDGFAVGPENGRRVEGRVEGHAQQRQAAADAFLVRAPPDRFEVPDHQRAEVRQRAACIDEGDHQDATGKPLKRHRAIALIAKLEGRHDRPGTARLATGGRASTPLPAAVTLTSSSQLRLAATTSVAAMRSPSRNPGVVPLTSNGMLMAGISPLTASWETTTRAGDGSKPTIVPVSG